MTRKYRIRLLWLLTALVGVSVLGPLVLSTFLGDRRLSGLVADILGPVFMVAGALSLFCIPAIVVLLVMGVLERRGRWGLADRTLGTYRYDPPAEQAAKWQPVDWLMLCARNVRAIAAIPVAYALYLLVTSLLFELLFGDRGEENWQIALLIANLVIGGILEFAALLALIALLVLLESRVALQPRRWRWVGVIWVSLGLALMLLAAVFSDQLQWLVNGDALRRVTPDDFHELMYPGSKKGDFPIPGYDWVTLTLVEAAFICLIGVTSAAVLRICATSSWPSEITVPVTILALLTVYCQWAAPYALIWDYDIFIGDRILGSLAFELMLFFFTSSEVAALVLAAYAAAMAWMFEIWQVRDGDVLSSTSIWKQRP